MSHQTAQAFYEQFGVVIHPTTAGQIQADLAAGIGRMTETGYETTGSPHAPILSIADGEIVSRGALGYLDSQGELVLLYPPHSVADYNRMGVPHWWAKEAVA